MFRTSPFPNLLHRSTRIAASVVWLLLVWLFVIGSVAAQGTDDAALQRGAAWLQAQVQASGQLTSEAASPASPAQARFETLLTLHTLERDAPPALFTAIEDAAEQTTEHLAYSALAAQIGATSDAASIRALLALQNTDGGFGAGEGSTSNALDTAWALRALAAKHTGSNETARALAWLLAQQQKDGRWTLAPEGDAVTVTAQTVQALAPYRAQTAARAALAKAREWLLAQQSAWEGEARTAQALLAVLPGLDSATAVQTTVDALRQAQRADGSWSGDAYGTALVLRALLLAAQPFTNPDLASVGGQVTDEEGLPIAGAVVRLENAGKRTQTDAQGRFAFDGLTAGQERLSIEATGYRSLLAPLGMQSGQHLELGVIRLSAVSAAQESVTIYGAARYFNGSASAVAANALIQVGGLSARTDRTGNYRIEGVPAGSLEVVATYSNYPAVRAAIRASAGQMIDFSPLFQMVPVSAATLNVRVTDADGQPLSSAYVRLNNAGRNTDAQGKVSFTSGVQEGSNTVTVSRSGYETNVMQFQAVGGQAIELTVMLRPVVSRITTLRGVVSDGGTPLAGVAVRLEGTAFETFTDAVGEYEITSDAISGNHTVIFEKTGYLTHQQAITIGTGATTVFNVPLLREPAAINSVARLTVNVHARGTGEPLEGALVTLDGANHRSARTDAAGGAVLDGLEPGETSIHISAHGYESVVTRTDIQTGQSYILPAELLPVVDPPVNPAVDPPASLRLYGQVVDAISQKPLVGAHITLTGAAPVDTPADGTYAFEGLAPGEVQLDVSYSGYETLRQTLTLSAPTEYSIALIPSWQVVQSSEWEVFGAVLDADTLEPLAGVQLELEEVVPGLAVIGTHAGITETGGSFIFSGLTQENARIIIRLNGYDTTVLPLSRQGGVSQSLGIIKLRRSYDAALPDLMLSLADRSALAMDDYSFHASGRLSAVVRNNSNYAAGGFDVIAFVDENGNQSWDADVDTLLARTRVDGLPPQQKQSISFDIEDAVLQFRDAPIYLHADSGMEVIENIEGNNTLRVGVSCAGAGGGVQDVAVCIDTSGSVGNLYALEMEGVIRAVENPNIIPHDGSVRFTLGTDWEMWKGQQPLHPATVIEPGTLAQLVQDLKSKRAQQGGWSYIPTCGLNMSKYLQTLPQQGSRKTLILVGDGHWEGINKTQTILPQTIANGVSRIDAIGVGAVNVPELRANVWPQPANTLHGGQVTVALSAGEVATAMAQALGAAAQTVDLSLGNFHILDQGADRPVRLAARVGNAGSPAQTSTVRFYQGARLLGEVSVPALKTGAWLDVALPDVTLSGDEALEAVVDEDGINAECNRANNRQRIPLTAANALARLSVTTDHPVYGVNAPVGLGAAAANLGSFAAAFELELAIEDEQGEQVARFDRRALGEIAVGAIQNAAQPWNTGRTLAGNYTLHGWLFDIAGREVAQSRAPFAIVAGGSTGAVTAALTASTDRAEYSPDDVVQLGNVARNLATNAIIDAARVRLRVFDPSGKAVFEHEHAIGQMPPGALRELDVPQTLRNAPQGAYTVQATLYGRLPGQQKFWQKLLKAQPTETELARASASYRVLAATNESARLSVTTDQPIYGANTPVDLGAAAVNLGSFAAAFELELAIEDEQGEQVARFDRRALGEIAVGAIQNAAQPWNTGRTLAGNYTLHGWLFDIAGREVAQSRAPFAIVAGGGTDVVPTAALTVSTDRAEYSQADVVQIGNVVRNLATNAIIDAARVHLRVFDPSGKAVFEHEHAIGQMSPGALRELGVQQTLRDAPQGSYTVQATLYGRLPGEQKHGQKTLEAQPAETELAHASTSYRVDAAPPAPPPPSPTRTTPVPASSPASLALLALAIAGAATRTRSRQRNDKGQRT